MSDRGPWQQTFSGVQFFPLDPRPEDIRLEDIAHALSLQCRFGGHCKFHYSVASHSVLVARLVELRMESTAETDDAAKEMQRAALLHDASEAYLVDVPSPVKACLKEYKAIEDLVMVAIFKRFSVRIPLWKHETIHTADLIMLSTEKRDLMGLSSAPWDDLLAPAQDIYIVPVAPQCAEEDFLAAARRLGIS